MALFTPPHPKGIYEKELHFVEGELKSHSFGSLDKLSDRQIDEVMDALRLSMDPDTMQDMKYGFRYVSQSEVQTIIAQLAHDTDLHFTPKQIEHVTRVLNKYVEIEKHPSMFSL